MTDLPFRSEISRAAVMDAPGRLFGAQRRWSRAVDFGVPQDVTKQSPGEQLALRRDRWGWWKEPLCFVEYFNDISQYDINYIYILINTDICF